MNNRDRHASEREKRKNLTMKNKTVRLMLLIGSGLLLQGCVAFPPLIQVEHKEASADSNKELMRRLDSIDQRLSQLEQKTDKK
jgi:hypothetical protein